MSMRPRARIHLRNIAGNWRLFDRVAGADGAGAVVKADAYGLGARSVSRALAEAGCRDFFVAYGFEGEAVREAVGPGPRIFVFNGPAAADPGQCAAAGLVPVLNSLHDIESHLAQASTAPFALHVDTGMNRLGVRVQDAGQARALLGACQPELVMTHFACADDPGSPMSEAQAAAFAGITAHFPGVPVSLANSAAHWRGAPMRAGLTRPGVGLYGGGNSPMRPAGLRHGLTLEAPILQVQAVPAGETIGYGASERVDRDTLAATVAIGYGDGIPRALGGVGRCYLEGVACRILGRVSMDLVTIDATAAQGVAKRGAWVEFLGEHADREGQAEAAGTLGYELITGLGSRVERIYET